MRGAPLVAVGLVLLVGFGVMLLFANGDDGSLPPTAQPRGATGDEGALPEPAPERVTVGHEAPPAAPRPPAATAPAEPAPRAEPAEAAPNVVLRVRDLATRADLAAFRWRFQADDLVLHGDGTDGAARLRLPPRQTGRLLVEALEHAPFVTSVAAPADGTPAATIDAFLQPAATGTGITLLVRDTALQPIPNVRVDAFLLAPAAADGPWHLGAPLWARRSAAADGRYVLPELAPGDYGVRVLATDADGKPLPLLPFRRAFVLTGSSGYVEEAVLEPGCLIEFDLVDANGAALDPAQAGAVQLQLRPAGGDAVARLWTVRDGPKPAVAVDLLPTVGVVTPDQALAAGNYEFTVAIDGRQRVQQFLTLRAGQVQRERIVVP